LTYWFFQGNPAYRYLCKLSYKPEHHVIHPVIGKIKVKGEYRNCSTERIGNADDTCGEKGMKWQPKHKGDLFKYIKHQSEIHE
jgi:hypothetical protein